DALAGEGIDRLLSSGDPGRGPAAPHQVLGDDAAQVARAEDEDVRHRYCAGVVGGGSAGGGGVSAGAAGAGSGVAATDGGSEKLTCTGSRSPGVSISKKSRFVNPPKPAITEFGNVWILVLYDWTLPL